MKLQLLKFRPVVDIVCIRNRFKYPGGIAIMGDEQFYKGLLPWQGQTRRFRWRISKMVDL